MKPTDPIGYNRDSKGRFEKDWIKRLANLWWMAVPILFALSIFGALVLMSGCQTMPAVPSIDDGPSGSGADPQVVRGIKWIMVAAGLASLAAGCIGAYMLGRVGSLIRAAACALAGFVIGLGCFAIAIYLMPLVKGMMICFGVALIVGLIAAALHYRKHLNRRKK